jgi:hypothetical protein
MKNSFAFTSLTRLFNSHSQGKLVRFKVALILALAVVGLLAIAPPIATGALVFAAPQVFVVTSAGDAGPGTLRDAITNANNNGNGSDQDLIEFNIPGPGPHTIRPLTPLPMITTPMKIDGFSQDSSGSGQHLIEIDGSLITTGAPFGLSVLNTSDVTIQGLVINRFGTKSNFGVRGTGRGINAMNATNLKILGNYLGTDLTGMKICLAPSPNPSNLTGREYGLACFSGGGTPLGNSDEGIRVLSNNQSTNAIIGGADPVFERNIISGNGVIGFTVALNGSKVQGNYIGVGVDGKTSLSNGVFGIQSGSNGPQNGQNHVIGCDDYDPVAKACTVPGQGNVISANNAQHFQNKSKMLPSTEFCYSYPWGGEAQINNFNAPNQFPDGACGASAPDRTILTDGHDNGQLLVSSPQSSTGSVTRVIGNKIGTDDEGNIRADITAAQNTGVLLNTGTTIIEGNKVAGLLGNGLVLRPRGIQAGPVQENIGSVVTHNEIVDNGLNGIVVSPYMHKGALITENEIARNGANGVLLRRNNYQVISQGVFGPLAQNFDHTLQGPSPRDIAIIGNSIYGNGALGIDLAEMKDDGTITFQPTFVWDDNNRVYQTLGDGVSLNDDGDNDGRSCKKGMPLDVSGQPFDRAVLSLPRVSPTADLVKDAEFVCPNNFQNYPVLTLVKHQGGAGTVLIEGFLNSKAGKTYLIEVFANKAGDAARQGRLFMGSTTVTLTRNGQWHFSFRVNANSLFLKGDPVTATATEMIDDGSGGLKPGSTSEFSASAVSQ